jgi:hypothetical protein
MGQSEQDRIIAAYMKASSRITESVVAAVQQRWREMTAYYDIDADKFLARVLPLISGGMTQIAAITDAYLSLMMSDQLGRNIPPKGINPDKLRNIRGVNSAEVYTRPFKTARAAIGEGLSVREAAERGFQRLMDITKSDLELASTHTSRDFLSNTTGVAGYRRVLSGSENCGMCVVASTQRYHKERLMPIHPGCDCKVRPIAGDQDPGQVIDSQRLESAHDAIAERFGEDAATRGGRKLDYRKVLLTEEHGELGPVLTVKSHRFTGPNAI